MGKWVGNYTEIDGELKLTECTELLTDVVVAAERIAIDWENNGEKFGTVLRPCTIDGMELWRGDIQGTIPPMKRGEIIGTRYDLKSGGAVLIVKWSQDDYGGQGMYEILPA